ncbi:solute carrier family 66 member 3 isoform 2-T2 [Geothlypis trichas]
MSLHTAAAESVSLCLGYSVARVPCGAGSCTRQTGFPLPNHLLVFLRYQIYYGYPLETYLEFPVVIAQDVILLSCIMHFSGKVRRACFYALVYWVGWYMITLQKWIIDLAMNLCTFISAASKLVQLQHLWETKDGGQASAVTWGMSVYASAARIITTLMTTKDFAVLIRFIVMLILNIWVTATILHYRKIKKTD